MEKEDKKETFGYHPLGCLEVGRLIHERYRIDQKLKEIGTDLSGCLEVAHLISEKNWVEEKIRNPMRISIFGNPCNEQYLSGDNKVCVAGSNLTK